MRIHYQSYGKGREALVLIHGWTCNLDYWQDQVPDFAKRNRVITLDLMEKVQQFNEAVIVFLNKNSLLK